MGILSNFFSKIKYKIVNSFSGYSAKSAKWNKDTYEQETVRAIIDCIATHTAKGKALHVVVDENDRIVEIKRQSPYAKLINKKPNPLMSGFDFKYKLITQLEHRTMAAAYVKWAKGQDGVVPEAIIPIDYKQMEICEIVGGGYAIQFEDMEGKLWQLPSEKVIILRKFYNGKDISGDGNGPIYNTLDMIQASDDGFIEALSVSNKVRGLYKHKKAMLDPKDVQNSQEEFSKRFADAAEKGGVVGIDSMEEYTPLNITPFTATSAQMKAVRDNLYTYWRICENVVKSCYSEQEGHAFAESIIEPRWLQMGEAFTNVCFSEREYDDGNRIIFTGGILTGTTYQTRVNIIRETKEIGLLTVNEQRELLGYDPIAGGDIRQVSLNYINADKQDEYQTGKENGNGSN